MQALLVLSLIVLFVGRIGGIFKTIRVNSNLNKSEINQLEVSPTPTVFATPSPKVISKKEVKGANIQINITEPSLSENQNTDISYYIYPHSNLINNSGDSLTLKTNDKSVDVTNWYKSKIQSKSMNVQSFVSTNTNGQILNKLIAANGNTKVEVDISGQEGQSLQIIVTISK